MEKKDTTLNVTDVADAEKKVVEIEEEEIQHSPSGWKNKLESSLYRKKFIYTLCLLFGNFMSVSRAFGLLW